MEIADKFNNYPNDLFSDVFKRKIDETKSSFNDGKEYINKPMVKCAVLGKASSGKSTLINALLERDILYEGIPEGTSCVAKCQSISNDGDYFQIYEGNERLDEHLDVNEIKNINHNNKFYLKTAMDINNYLDIFLNVPNHWILNKFLLIDCPGYNDNNLEIISKYCKYADILIFCFGAESGVTDKDIHTIDKIKMDIKIFQAIFIINRCDKCDNIDRNGIINKLSPYLTGENEIYFISALEEKIERFDDERHREFEQFKQGLQRQKSNASNTCRKIFLKFSCSVRELIDSLNFTNFRECRFTESAFDELHQQIKKLINEDTKIYYKSDYDYGFLDYSNLANKEISKFLMNEFINDSRLKNGIIADDYFYKRFIRNDDIRKPFFMWFRMGSQNETIKKIFLDYFLINLRKIQLDMKQYYNEQILRCLNELGNYKNELNAIKMNFKNLVI